MRILVLIPLLLFAFQSLGQSDTVSVLLKKALPFAFNPPFGF